MVRFCCLAPASWVVAFFLSLVFLGPVGWCKPEAFDPPPPLAQEQAVTVYRGESVVITLQARGRDAKKASFLLRSRPRIGRLGELTPALPGTATVVYQASENIGTDEFTFAVQSPGSPVSAPGRVRIYTVPRPPELEVPGELNLGEVPVGGEIEASIELGNVGDGVWRGRLVVEGDWELISGEDVAIAAGEKQSVQVKLRPTLEREYTGSLRVLGAQTKLIPLRANGRALWRVLPGQIELLPGEETNSPMIVVKNFHSRPLEVRVAGPDGVELPTQVSVPGEGEVSFPVRRRMDFLGGSEGEIVLTSELGRWEVPMRVFPFPARLEIAPVGGIDLTQEASGGGDLTLSNVGGLPGEVRWELPEFLRSEINSPVLLEPGEARKIRLYLRSLLGLPSEYALDFRLGSEVRTVQLKLPESLSASQPAARPPFSQSAEAVPFSPRQAEEAMVEPEVPESFRELQLHHRGEHRLVFGFQDSTAGVAVHRLEKREIAPNNQGELEIVWREFPPTVVEDGPSGTRRFTLQGLPTGVRLHLRIVSLNDRGGVLAQTPPFSLSTQAPAASWWPSPSVWIPVLLLGGGGWWIFRRRRQQILAAEAEDRRRIAALEGERRI